jgi:hypothetical protein
MASDANPTGAFTCEITLRRTRPPEVVVEQQGGITYLVARSYELAYETTLRFTGGAEVPVKARLFGELNRQVVFRDASGRPVRGSGWVQGRVEITDAEGRLIFRGPYYDSRVIQTFAGDEAFTRTSQHVDHWENGFGEGPYAGHAFSLGVALTWEAPVHRGHGRGQID